MSNKRIASLFSWEDFNYSINWAPAFHHPLQIDYTLLSSRVGIRRSKAKNKRGGWSALGAIVRTVLTLEAAVAALMISRSRARTNHLISVLMFPFHVVQGILVEPWWLHLTCTVCPESDLVSVPEQAFVSISLLCVGFVLYYTVDLSVHSVLHRLNRPFPNCENRLLPRMCCCSEAACDAAVNSSSVSN